MNAFCSISPAGRLSINVEPRLTDLALTVLPTLMLGPALGVAALGVRRVFVTLEESADDISA
ncbi:MAG: hypothetical protein GY745_12710 [Actinomycetia bacterium]|nr:hypothetical protein [Actinomycetes bacterium]MCP3909792.1 hypothetical protein [Actinomycetes bacterium]MCP4085898.1 hypothetical protein [Actinomycetes bacterium]